MISGFCGQISLGHAAFYGVSVHTRAPYLPRPAPPFLLAISAGMIAAGLVGLMVGLASLRVRHDFLAITTMGVGFLFLGIVRQQEILGGELGISAIPSSGFGKIGYLVHGSDPGSPLWQRFQFVDQTILDGLCFRCGGR